MTSINYWKNTIFFDRPRGLPPERYIVLKIELEHGTKPVMGSMYKLSVAELQEMKIQITKLLENVFIRPSISPWGSPV